MTIQLPLIVLLAALGPTTTAAATEVLAADKPTMIDGVETVCTGAGLDARADPRWPEYPTRLEFADKHGRYLGDATVHVTGNGKNISVHCQGPWVLMKLPEGSYKVSTDIAGSGRRDLTVNAPGRVIVQF